MKNKKIKLNVFFNNNGEELEKLVIEALINYLNFNLKEALDV